jgi:hypothetical protein
MLMEPAETFLAATQTNGQGHFLFVGPWSGPFRLRCYSEDFRKMARSRCAVLRAISGSKLGR